MGSFFRSEEVALCQLFLQSETAYACVSELGELGLVQFRDLNPDVNAFQRKFVNEVRRCDEMERKLRFLEKEIKKDGIPMTECPTIPEAPQPRDMIDLEATFEKLENELKEVNQNAEALKRNFLELTELKHVLKKTQIFFDEINESIPVPDDEQLAFLDEESLQHDGGIQNSESMTKALISDDSIGSHQPNMGQVQLGFLAGVILREKIPAFERMLWRACRGNVFLRQTEISIPLEDPSTGDNVYKCVFIIFFQGDQLRTRVKKICEGFRATLYPCPDVPVDRREMSMGVVTRIEDLNTVLGQTQDHRHRVLVAAAKNIKSWSIKVRKIKAIYHTLNLFNLDVTQKCLIAECWVPVLDIEAIQLALRRGTEQSGSSIAPILNRTSTSESPPTFNRTNKFTSAFQELINVYGVSTYREVNPAQYTIITFPFLFAVMFGDIGHGLILFLFALWMIIKEKPLLAQHSKQELWNILFGGRYIIFLMGLFALYTGLLYNDMFSKSLSIFSSSWMNHYTANELKNLTSVTLNPIKDLGYTGTPYFFGFDPVWQLAQNKIIFHNSFKMKFSIIVGSIHMLFGLSLSLVNYLFFRKEINIFLTFIPQVLFFSCLFIYLSLLSFIKWTTYFAYNDKTEPEMAAYGPSCAPSILITFINMFLFKENQNWGEHCTPYMYAGEQNIESFLMIISLLCIPYLFFAKPYYYFKKNRNRKPYLIQNVEEGGQMVQPQINHTSIDVDENAGIHDSEESDLSEIFILNGIHSIEFILGTVSHTASYLRLWALSLAHAQLSDVLWKMVLSKGFVVEGWLGGVALYMIFMIWACLTIGILVLMEGLSAFLHTLRLHWVEFQTKFYEGAGYAFQPFSFETIIHADHSSDD